MITQAKAKISRILPKSSFGRGVGVLAGGTAIAQLLTVMAAPLLTRLYTPEDFGLIAVFTSLTGLVSVIASLRYELAIPLPEDNQEAAHVVALSLMVVIGISLLVSGIILFFSNPIASTLGVPELSTLLWLVPVGVLLGGFYRVFNYWAIRCKRFPSIASTKLRQAVATLTIQIAGYKFGGTALIFGRAGGQVAGTFKLGRQALTQPAFQELSWQGIKQVARRYKRFPFFSTWSGFANTAGLQLPPLMFAVFFGAGGAGLYSLAHRILSVPMTLLGQAVGQVFFSSAAKANREGELAPLVANVHYQLAQIAMPPALIIALTAPDLFALAFGEEWRLAGDFARWMTPWLYLVFVASPLNTLFSVMEKQGAGLTFQIILLTCRVSAILLGAYWHDLLLTVMLFSAASTFCWVGFLLWIGHHSGNNLYTMIKPTMEAFIIALLCLTPLWLSLLLSLTSQTIWFYAMGLSTLIISTRYWFILRKVF